MYQVTIRHERETLSWVPRCDGCVLFRLLRYSFFCISTKYVRLRRKNSRDLNIILIQTNSVILVIARVNTELLLQVTVQCLECACCSLSSNQVSMVTNWLSSLGKGDCGEVSDALTRALDHKLREPIFEWVPGYRQWWKFVTFWEQRTLLYTSSGTVNLRK